MAAENHASEATPAALRPSLYRADTPTTLSQRTECPVVSARSVGEHADESL